MAFGVTGPGKRSRLWSGGPSEHEGDWQDVGACAQRIVAVTGAALLLLSGCTGSGSTSSTSAPTAGPDDGWSTRTPNATAVATTRSTTVEDDGSPRSMREWEALWAQERDAIVKRITAAGGKTTDGKTVLGATGFRIDLEHCPKDWRDTEGLSDSTIKIGQTLPRSGPAADYGNVGTAMATIFDYYGRQGAFTDSLGKTRTITYIEKDDGYDPARTIPLVDELVELNRVFAVSTLGSAPALKTYDRLNERCVPQPFVQSGHPAWGDPVNHPWTTGQQLAYNTEAVLWGAFVEAHFDELKNAAGKVVVASLVTDNDFGRAYDLAFANYVTSSDHVGDIVYTPLRVDPNAPTITDQMTTVAAARPAVFIAMVFSSFCTQVAIEAANNGLADRASYLFQPSVCPGNTYLKAPAVGGDGSAADGWWQVNAGTKDINDPELASDPFIVWSRSLLSAHRIDAGTSSSLGTGLYFGWAWVQALRIAGELEGGLTRTNLMLAVRAMDMTHPYQLDGIGFNADGVKDAYLTEGGVLQVWNAATQRWEAQGDVIDLSGRSSNCVYDPVRGICRSS